MTEEKKRREIKLIATDMDGTLVNDQKEVPASFDNWVLSHPDQQMVIASGRPYYTNEELFSKIKDHLIFIGDNGGVIYQQGKVLAKSGLTSEEAAFCLDLFKDDPIASPILCGLKEGISHDPKDDKLFLKQLDTYYIKRRYAEDLAKEVDSDEMIKVSVYFGDRDAESRFKKLPPMPADMDAVLAGPEWIDFVNKEANKGTALTKIAEMKGIPKDEVLAFGDYLNDYTMLEAAGLSYAMVNGHPDLKAIADEIAPSNNEEGVMQVLRQLFD